jgi:hypothetical protein
MTASAASNVLDRVLDPFVACLTREVARRLLDLHADPQAQARLDLLAEKANEGRLSVEEQAEYDRYREAFHFVTVLQLKARSFLDQKASP